MARVPEIAQLGLQAPGPGPFTQPPCPLGGVVDSSGSSQWASVFITSNAEKQRKQIRDVFKFCVYFAKSRITKSSLPGNLYIYITPNGMQSCVPTP